MTDFDEVIAQIEAGLQKLKAYGNARYKQGVADERERAIAAIQGGGKPSGSRPILISAEKARLDVTDRVRAPRGLAREMVVRALNDAGPKGVKSVTIVENAKTPAEKMVSLGAIRNEFRLLRDDSKCELRDGAWHPIGAKK